MPNKNLQIVQSGGGKGNSTLGKIDKNYQKKQYLSNRFLGNLKDFCCNFFNRLNRFRKSRSGVILIEFAFSVPVFLALIYYAHDLPRLKRFQRKTQFVANEIAMVLQNFAAQRTKEKKKISMNDLRLAVRIAGLSIFPGITQYSLYSFTKMPLAYMQIILIYYVVGGASGSAKVKWWYRIHPGANQSGGYHMMKNQADGANDRLVNVKGTTASAIYPGLKISENEAKIIVEACLHVPSLEYGSPGKVFGFLFYRPPTTSQYFGQVAIFTPQGDAFTEAIPQ